MRRTKIDQKCYRIIPSHFPPIRLFERLLEPDELEDAYLLESLTNDRLRHEVGDIRLVPKEDIVCGEGTSAIMAAFTHIGSTGRFNTPLFGVYYAGLTLKTAIEESKNSRARFLSATNETALDFKMRCYICQVNADLVDLRDDDLAHDQHSYAYSQAKAVELRQKDEVGLLYRSVRNEGGECIAALRTKALIPPCQQSSHYLYHWDGKEISHVTELREI